MTKLTLRIATRKSPLALWQAHYVGNLLTQHWPDVRYELVPMVTSGDRFLKDKLQAVGGKGLFVKELEESLLAQTADFAVHSMKDVPAVLPEGLVLTAICKRDNPLDAVISPRYQTIDQLPPGSLVGTASLRRQAQLLAHRPDLIIKPLRGNINTRLDKLQAGEYDAIILAAAGLERLNLDNFITQRLTDDWMLPACGQGALGIESRVDDETLRTYLAPLNDAITADCVFTERQVNARLGGNCHVPVAVYATPQADDCLTLRAKVMTPDGSTMLYDERHAPRQQWLDLANAAAEALLSQGAEQLLQSCHHD